MEAPPGPSLPEKPSIDHPEIEVYAARVEADHDRLIQKIFFMVILPLYFLTVWIAIFMLAEEPYESTFKWATAIVVGTFLFAFQTKIRAILAKLFLH